MGTETSAFEYEQAEAKTDSETQTKVRKEQKIKLRANGEIQLFGVRALLMNPLSACEKLDRIFGSGGEAIVHHMWFESGQSLFDNMIKCNPSINMEELLRALIDAQPRTGWGNMSVKIIRTSPPAVDVAVRNPPVKTVKGSQKHLIGSFWAGVFSKYFNRQLICKSFGYDSEKDEFTCTITI